MNRRGDGMSINTIVMMVLALVVMAVLLFLTYKYVLKPGEQAGTAGTCAGQGGVCKVDCVEGERGVVGLGCPGQNDAKSAIFCCTPTK